MNDLLPPLAQRYLEAQVEGNRARALRVIIEEGLECGVEVPDLHLSVIQPAQYEIGRLWQENRLSIAQEHVATAISQLAMAHLYRHMPRARQNGKKVLIGCVEGELHDMGPRIATDFLEMAGFEVRFLGANVPTDSLVEMVGRERPDLVALSVSLIFNLPALRRAVTRIRETFDNGVQIAVGGHALQWAPALQDQLSVPSFGKDAREMVAAAQQILKVS
jgi:methanogenic corrinoid protein MtbC1